MKEKITILGAGSWGTTLAVVLSKKMTKNSVQIIASQVATDTLGLAQRNSLTSLDATTRASQKAFQQAGITQKDVCIAEVHDCFTIAEILALEDMGFAKKGEAGTLIARGAFTLGKSKKTVVNTSGGLKACGHPVGATGVKQIVEITDQLRGRCGQRNVEHVRVGLAHNVGGTGGTAVVHILQKDPYE